MSTSKMVIIWLLRIVAAFIMVQSLFFKFSGAAESVYIFSTLGMEPWGRIGTGIVELIAAVLLVVPRTTWMGALLGLGTMSGAILSHITMLGIEVANDGGQLFLYAVVTWGCCAALILIERERIKTVLRLNLSK